MTNKVVYIYNVEIRKSKSEKAMLQRKGVYQQWQSRMKNLFSTFSADQLTDDF